MHLAVFEFAFLKHHSIDCQSSDSVVLVLQHLALINYIHVDEGLEWLGLISDDVG